MRLRQNRSTSPASSSFPQAHILPSWPPSTTIQATPGICGTIPIVIATCPAVIAAAAQVRSQRPSWRLPPTALTAVLSLAHPQRSTFDEAAAGTIIIQSKSSRKRAQTGDC